jgi:predicted nucleic acid-binding protein
MITGLDANIVCYILDDAYPEHETAKNLLHQLTPENRIALNPTTIHEAYHTLVRSQKWLPEEAADALLTLINMPNTEFYNQTKKISSIALNIAVEYKLGGRDSLIVANFLANNTPQMYTHDNGLLKHQKITYKNTNLTIKDPVNEK